MVFSRDRDIQHEQKIFSAMRGAYFRILTSHDYKVIPAKTFALIKLIELPAEVITMTSVRQKY